GQPARAAAPRRRERRYRAHFRSAAAAAGLPWRGGDLPVAAGAGDLRDRARRAVHPGLAGADHRLSGRRAAVRCGADGRGRAGLCERDHRQMAADRPDRRGGASAVEFVRLAQRGLRQLRRNGCRTMVRARRDGYSRSESVAAWSRCPYRSRCVVRVLLATGGGFGDPRRRRDGGTRLCGADPSVPRSDHVHGHRHPAAGRHPRPALCRAARRHHRRGRHHRTGLAGDARRHRAAVDALVGQSHRALGRGLRPRSRRPMSGKFYDAPIDEYLPQNGNRGYRVSRYELDLTYKVASNRLAARADITAVTTEVRPRFALDLSQTLTVSKVLVNGAKVAKYSHQRGKLVITPQQRIPAGGLLAITVQYAGTPRPVRGPWGEVGWEELTDGALVASQPNGAASWFPCDDHPSSKASYRISITTDTPYYALANGTLLRKQTKASQT